MPSDIVGSFACPQCRSIHQIKVMVHAEDPNSIYIVCEQCGRINKAMITGHANLLSKFKL